MGRERIMNRVKYWPYNYWQRSPRARGASCDSVGVNAMLIRAVIAILLCSQTLLSNAVCVALFCTSAPVAAVQTGAESTFACIAPCNPPPVTVSQCGMPCPATTDEPIDPPSPCVPGESCNMQACPFDVDWVPTGLVVDLLPHKLLYALAPLSARIQSTTPFRPIASSIRTPHARAPSAKERCALVCIWRE